MNRKFLIIQTAFTGDVILATALVEKLKTAFPASVIDMLVRKGNESLLENNPHLRKIITWNKTENKFGNLFRLAGTIRAEKYSTVINLHRFASSGLVTVFSGAKEKIGFDKNPWSLLYTRRIKHDLTHGKHEIERNQELIAELTGPEPRKPRLYPSDADYSAVKRFKQDKYICIAPGSVWFTKKFPEAKWSEFIRAFSARNPSSNIYLLGAASDRAVCERIRDGSPVPRLVILAGDLSYLESAALMKDAQRNYMNDSAPLHMAGAMNAAVTVVFCSTTPEFGFGPLSDQSKIVETKEKLDCRPCGIHGYHACPEKHFKCALTIDINQLLSPND